MLKVFVVFHETLHPTSHTASDTPPAILASVGTDLGCGFK